MVYTSIHTYIRAHPEERLSVNSKCILQNNRFAASCFSPEGNQKMRKGILDVKLRAVTQEIAGTLRLCASLGNNL